MPNVLMVTPYWPPVNKVGVWRVLRTARYLPERDWTPIICTPRPEQVYKDPPLSDASFATPDYEVIRPDTWIPSVATIRGLAQPHAWVQQRQALGSPHPIYRALSSMTGLLDRGSTRVIAEMLAPDQFVEWGAQAARQLKHRRDIDVVWATGGPFGFFVAGVLIAAALDRPLVLDYRDPWTTHRPPRTWWIAPPQRVFRMIEAWALTRASGVGYIHHEALAANRAAFGQPPEAMWSVISNSFDEIDLGSLPPRKLSEETQTPALVYAGNFYDERSAASLIQGLFDLEEAEREGEPYPLTAHIFGQLDKRARALLKNRPLDASRLKLYPRHSAEEIGAIMRGAEALLLVIGDGHAHSTAVSGKVWDYLAARTTIVGLGPPNAAARSLLSHHKLGVWANSLDREAVLDRLKQVSRGQLESPSTHALDSLHARAMSGAVADLLDHALISPRPTNTSTH